jgi:gamma-glutamyl-gamma-aminobutyrate hydrolase PuuD
MAPLIAVTCRVLAAVDAGDGFRQDLLASPRTYLDALHRSGAVEAAMLAVPLDAAGARARLERVDGLLLTGGPDVDPVRYGQERHPETYGVSAVRDDFEATLTLAAIEMGLPTLAICRGIQVLNVALGGTLVQHLPTSPPRCTGRVSATRWRSRPARGSTPRSAPTGPWGCRGTTRRSTASGPGWW